MPAPSSRVLDRIELRAALAASLASAAEYAFLTILLASVGFSSSHAPSASLVTLVTSERIAVLPSLALVWPSNCGSCNRTEMTAVRPSRTSSPVRARSFLDFAGGCSLAYLLIVEVRAVLNPSSWVPPSMVEMPLAKEWMPSRLYPVFHWNATSTSWVSSAPSK